MDEPENLPDQLKVDLAREKHSRTFALMDLRRSIHAERANQLRDQSASMHRWVMASLLVLNTGAMVTMLGRDGVVMANMVEQLSAWAVGACFAITAGTLNSSADQQDAEIWQDLASTDYEMVNPAEMAEREKDRRDAYWTRMTAGAMQFASMISFAVGIAFAV